MNRKFDVASYILNFGEMYGRLFANELNVSPLLTTKSKYCNENDQIRQLIDGE